MPYSKLELKVRRLERERQTLSAYTASAYGKWMVLNEKRDFVSVRLRKAKAELEEEWESLSEV